MRCEDTQSALIDFYYQELDTAGHRSVSAHLVSCPGCAAEYRLLHVDLSAAEASWSAEPSPALHAALRARAEEAIAPTFWQRAMDALAVRVPVYQAAVAAAVIVVLWAGLGPGIVPSLRHAAPMASQQGAPEVNQPASQPHRARAVPVNYDAQGLMAVDDHLL